MTRVEAHDPDPIEIRKEGYAMALYIAICLLAALTAIPDDSHGGTPDVLAIVWGTTIGLALAHWFAFRLSALLVAAGTIRAHDAATMGAHLAAAATVAAISTVAVVLAPDAAEVDVVRLVLAGLVGLVGFVVARTGGASTLRSLAYAATVYVVATTIAVLKNVLVGH